MRKLISPLLLLLLGAIPCTATDTSTQDLHSLWKATGPAGGVVYLLGSVHALPQNAYPLAPAIENAFKESTTLAFEVDFDAMENSGPALFAAGSLLPGQSLYNSISEQTSGDFRAYLGSAGLSPEIFDSMRPWMAALSLTALELVKIGYSPDAGIDITLARRASKSGKKIIGLETAEDQISLFSNLSEEESEAFLRYTIKDLRTLTEDLDKITEAWQHGDVKMLRKLLGEAFRGEPEISQRFVSDRNQKWMPKILKLFGKGHRSMAVVGALHLVGKNGVLELLSRAGFEIEQL